MQNLTIGAGEVALRLGAALFSGAIIGINRDLHGKPAGMRTFGLMTLGTAALTVALAQYGDPSTIGRAVQGMITGIGFLGAGMIVRPALDNGAVHGLTTAAAVWLAAALAILCGLGLVALSAGILAIALLLLSVGEPIEKFFERLVDARDRARVANALHPPDRDAGPGAGQS